MRALLPAAALLLTFTACATEPERERSEQIAQRIVAGQPSTDDDDAVVVLEADNDVVCTGTLIAPNAVLTARHCFTGIDPLVGACTGKFNGELSHFFLSVVVGKRPDLTRHVAKGARVLTSSEAVLCGHDLAVIMLDGPVPNAKTVKVRRTPPRQGEATRLVGYGLDENEKLDGRRARTGNVTQLGPARPVFKEGDKETIFFVDEREFTTGEGACGGDSGGPVFDAKGQVLGVVSRAVNGRCVGAPVVNVATASHLQVLQQALEQAGVDPDTVLSADEPQADDPGGCQVGPRPSGSGALLCLGAFFAFAWRRRRRSNEAR